MKKLVALLGVVAALTTASTSYAHCECRERPRFGHERHGGEVLLVKEGGFSGHRVLAEFEYHGFEGKHHAWRRCEHAKREHHECRW